MFGVRILLLFVGWLIVELLCRGIALMLLWGWFVVPTLGLPAISLVQAMGIVLVVALLMEKYNPREDDDDGTKKVLFPFIHSLLAVSLGWVVHLFM